MLDIIFLDIVFLDRYSPLKGEYECLHCSIFKAYLWKIIACFIRITLGLYNYQKDEPCSIIPRWANINRLLKVV